MSFERKKRVLFVLLCAIFLTHALLAELIGVKIFSLERTLGFLPVRWSFFGYAQPLGFHLTAGVLLWPVVFIATDVINEYFGPRGVRQISFLTAGCIAYSFLMIYIATRLVPAEFWLDIHHSDAWGRPFDINAAFSRLFGQGLHIIIGSLAAFLLSQFLDVWVFHRLRRITGSKKVWLRATGSTLVSQLVDSFVVLFFAFYILAPAGLRWSIPQLLAVSTINYIYKFVVAVLLTPLIYLSHSFIARYLGRSGAENMATAAARRGRSFWQGLYK